MDFHNPPPHIREHFRRALLTGGGSLVGLSVQGAHEELKKLDVYLQTFEDLIEQQEVEELHVLEDRASTLPEENRGDFWAWHYPVHWDEIFRTNLRSSFLISLMSMMEAQLAQLCRDVAEIARAPIRVGDLRGSALERTELFLRTFGQFRRPDNDQWQQVAAIYEVRNVYVHSSGALHRFARKDRIIEMTKEGCGLVESNGFLTLRKEFCPNALSKVLAFFDLLAEEQAALCERARKFEGF